MPHHIKFMLSVGCLATALCGYFFLASLGQTGPSYAAIFLGIFATAAMWVFPEVMKKNVKADKAR